MDVAFGRAAFEAGTLKRGFRWCSGGLHEKVGCNGRSYLGMCKLPQGSRFQPAAQGGQKSALTCACDLTVLTFVRRADFALALDLPASVACFGPT